MTTPKPCERPRICTGCQRGPRRCSYSGGRCSTCYRRAGGAIPRNIAPCLNECGDLADGASGFCRRCYQAVWKRSRAWARMTGSTLSLFTAAAAVDTLRAEDAIQAEAVRCLRRLVRGLLSGEIGMMHTPLTRRLLRVRAQGRYVAAPVPA